MSGVFHVNNARSAILDAAWQARRDGQINLRQYARIRLASRRDEVVEAIGEAIADEASRPGVSLPKGAVSENGAIDFMKLLDFIKTLMPLILQLIALFGA